MDMDFGFGIEIAFRAVTADGPLPSPRRVISQDGPLSSLGVSPRCAAPRPQASRRPGLVPGGGRCRRTP